MASRPRSSPFSGGATLFGDDFDEFWVVALVYYDPCDTLGEGGRIKEYRIDDSGALPIDIAPSSVGVGEGCQALAVVVDGRDGVFAGLVDVAPPTAFPVSHPGTALAKTIGIFKCLWKCLIALFIDKNFVAVDSPHTSTGTKPSLNVSWK